MISPDLVQQVTGYLRHTAECAIQNNGKRWEPNYMRRLGRWWGAWVPDSSAHYDCTCGRDKAEALLVGIVERVKELEAERDKVLWLVKGDPAVDRAWKDETLCQAITIVLNSLFYRRKAHEAAEARAQELEAERDEALDFNRQAHRILNNAGVPANSNPRGSTDGALYLWQRVEWLVGRVQELEAAKESGIKRVTELVEATEVLVQRAEAAEARVQELEHQNAQHISDLNFARERQVYWEVEAYRLEREVAALAVPQPAQHKVIRAVWGCNACGVTAPWPSESGMHGGGCRGDVVELEAR